MTSNSTLSKWLNLTLLASNHTNPTTNHTLRIYRTHKSMRDIDADAEEMRNLLKSENNVFSDLCQLGNDSKASQIVFCVHGAGGCAEQFRYLLDSFSKDVSNVVYAFDWYGHRESFNENGNEWHEYGATKLEKDLDFFVETCLEEYRQRGWSEKPRIIFVAHSYGTGILMRLLRSKVEEFAMENKSSYVELIDKVALLSTTDSCPKVAQSVLWRLPVFLVEWIRPWLSNLNKRIMYHEATSEEEVNYWKDIASKNSIAMMKALCRQMEWYTLEDANYLHESMPQWKFLLLSGENDQVTTPNDARNVAEACNADMAVIAQCSHNLMVERPDEVTKFILNDSRGDTDQQK